MAGNRNGAGDAVPAWRRKCEAWRTRRRGRKNLRQPRATCCAVRIPATVPQKLGRARRHGRRGAACRRMLAGHGFSRKRHFPWPFHAVSGWKGAAEDAAPQGPRASAAGSPDRRCAPGRARCRGAVHTLARPHATGPEQAGGWLQGRGAMAGKRQHLIRGLAVAGTGRPGRAARGQKRHGETRACALKRDARNAHSGNDITRDNCRYRE